MIRARKRPSMQATANPPRRSGRAPPTLFGAAARPSHRATWPKRTLGRAEARHASRATETHLLGGGEPKTRDPTDSRRAAPPRRHHEATAGRAARPSRRSSEHGRSRTEAWVRQCRPPEPSGTGRRHAAASPSGPMATGHAYLTGTKPMGASSSGTAATPDRSQRILWLHKALRSTERGKPTGVGWQHRAMAGGTRAQRREGTGLRRRGTSGQGGKSFEGSAPSRTANRAAPSSEGATKPARNMANPMAGCRVQ